jgi:hypothetical protein
MFTRKEKKLPTNETTDAQSCVQLWQVRWESRWGAFNSDISPEIEAFTSKEEAEQFADSLKDAFALLKHRGDGTDVTIAKAN